MGCINSVDFLVAQKRRFAAEKRLKSIVNEVKRNFNILLLGPGESGKSTIFKQIKQIHVTEYTESDLLSHKKIVHSNVFQSMVTVLMAMSQLKISYTLPESADYAERLLSLPQGQAAPSFEKIGPLICQLWKDEGVRVCVSRSNEFQLNDSAEYYFDCLDEICKPDYIPTVDHVLRTRVKTTGLTDIQFIFNNISFRILDVGGQRSERKKWIHCFSDVTAVLFVASLSEYNLMLLEDPTVNRMQESLKLFDSIVNNDIFKGKSVILFLNKYDIFLKVIMTHSIAETFPDFEGDDKDELIVRGFIKRKFLDCCDGRHVYTHYLCATDTNNVTVVFMDVVDVITREHLKSAGLI